MLRDWTARHALLHWLALRLAVHRRLRVAAAHVRLGVGCGSVGRLLTAVLGSHGRGAVCSMLRVLRGVGLGWHLLVSLATVMTAVVVIRAAILAAGGLRAVGNNLHAARN